MLSGRKVAKVVPGKGLRQKDPLSSKLFIIVADILSKMIKVYSDNGRIWGVKLARGCL